MKACPMDYRLAALPFYPQLQTHVSKVCHTYGYFSISSLLKQTVLQIEVLYHTVLGRSKAKGQITFECSKPNLIPHGVSKAQPDVCTRTVNAVDVADAIVDCSEPVVHHELERSFLLYERGLIIYEPGAFKD